MSTNARDLYRPLNLNSISATLSLNCIVQERRRKQAERLGRKLHKIRVALDRAHGFDFNGPCECGRNHQGIRLGGKTFCPYLLKMWCNRLAVDGHERARDFLLVPDERLIQKLDAEMDASFLETEWIAPQPPLKEYTERRACESKQ